MSNRSAMFSAFGAWLGVALLAIAAPVLAQDQMDKPVHILVGFAPGGTADLIARVVADKLKDSIGAAGDRRKPARRRGADRRRRGQGRGARWHDDHGDADRPDGGGSAHAASRSAFDHAEGLHADRAWRDVPVRARRRPESGAKTWAEYVDVGQGESGESVLRDVRRRQPAAFHRRAPFARDRRRHGACRRTRAPQRTSTI